MIFFNVKTSFLLLIFSVLYKCQEIDVQQFIPFNYDSNIIPKTNDNGIIF